MPSQSYTYLDNIMHWKREEVPKTMRETPAALLRASAAVCPKPLDFAAALRPAAAEPGHVRLIAEIKRASPSKGLITQDFAPTDLARTYALGGASAISVLTDKRFFQGSLDHLVEARAALSEMSRERAKGLGVASQAARDPATIPLLRKDFIFEPYQIIEARAAGADALLLIVSVLSDTELHTLLAETQHFGMEALVEVHDEHEVQRAVEIGAKVMGINNRDLATFTVDLSTTERLRALIPPEVIVVSESGIRDREDVRRLADMGVDAILVGESIIKAKNRLAKVRELAGV